MLLTSTLVLWTMNCIDAALRMLLASNSVTGIIRKGFEILCQAPPPVCLPSVYLMSLHVTSSSGPPSIFAYCKWSKNGGGNGLGTRLAQSMVSGLSVHQGEGEVHAFIGSRALIHRPTSCCSQPCTHKRLWILFGWVEVSRTLCSMN